MLPTLHGGSGGQFEGGTTDDTLNRHSMVACTPTRGERFKVVEYWRLGGVCRGWFWGGVLVLAPFRATHMAWASTGRTGP